MPPVAKPQQTTAATRIENTLSHLLRATAVVVTTVADAMLELAATELQDADAIMEDTGDLQQQIEHNPDDGEEEVTHQSGRYLDDAIRLQLVMLMKVCATTAWSLVTTATSMFCTSLDLSD